MAARGRVIHSCCSSLAQTISPIHHLLDLTNALNCNDGEILHEYAFVLVLFQVKLLVRILAK